MPDGSEEQPITDFDSLPDKVISLIRELQGDENHWKRRDAAFALEQYTEAEVTRVLTQAALKEKDSNVLEGIAIALGGHTVTEEVLTSLRHILNMQGAEYQWSRDRARGVISDLLKLD